VNLKNLFIRFVLSVLGNVMTNNEIRWLGDSWRHSTVFAILILDSEIELQFLQQLIANKVLPQCPRLTEKPVILTNLFGNSHCWMSDRNSFDINQHVFRSRKNPMEKHELQVSTNVGIAVGTYIIFSFICMYK